MKRTIATITGLVAALTAGAAMAADEVTLQLKWVTQAQFAGYYVALDKGYYDDEGLDVTINPGGPGHCTSADHFRRRRRCHH